MDTANELITESKLTPLSHSRRLRVYRIPYQALTDLVSPSPLPSGSVAQTITVPTQLTLPGDAEVLNVWENHPAQALDLLIHSQEFVEVPIGEIAPPCVVDIPMREVVAVEPWYLEDLKYRAKMWDQFAVQLAPRKHSPTFRWVFRWDSVLWLYRLCRFTYEVGERGQKGWHAIQWTFGLVPTFYKFRREDQNWILRVFGLRIHRKVCYGGRPD